MFPKLLVLVLTTILTAGVLLQLRQRRLDLAHESAQIHRRLHERHMELWRLQAEIAARCRPEAIRLSLRELEAEWRPIPTPNATVPAGGARVAGTHERADLGG